MLLRWLVGNFVRQAAQQKLQETVAEMAQQQLGGAEDDNDDAPVAAGPCDLVVLFATGIESGGMLHLLSNRVTTNCAAFIEHDGILNGRRVVVGETGIGGELAARATADVIAIHKPTWVVSAGFASALNDTARRGHVLMADQVADEQGGQLKIGLKMEPSQGVHVGRLLTVDRVIRTPEERRKLFRDHDAIACDMETMAVARVCAQHKTRFISVRVISDAVDDRLSAEIASLTNQHTTAAKLGAAAGAIFKRPGSVKDMWKLKDDAFRASDRLAKFLTGVVEQLQ